MVETNLFILPQQCNIQLNRKMMSELAIHEPRSFKVCLQLYTGSKERRRNEGGRQGQVGIQAKERVRGCKKAGRHAG